MGSYDSKNEGLAQALAYAAELATAGRGTFDHPAGGKAVLVPEGYDVQRLAPAYEQPAFISARPVFDRRESFQDYVNDFKGANTRVLASISGGQMAALIDYHGKADGAQPVQHVATLKLQRSPEWNRWMGINDRAMEQIDFANFIEENIDDIVAPAGADLLEMVENFSENRTVAFQSKVKRSNGSVVMSFRDEEDPKAGEGRVKIPEVMTLSLAIYDGEAKQRVDAFVRHKVDNGKLRLTVKLMKTQEHSQAAFQKICLDVSASTSIVVGHGSYAYDTRR